MKNLILLFFIFLAFSCKDNPCDGVVCQNGGNCQNGQCDCPANYQGLDCAVEKTPQSIIISRLSVLNFPPTTPSGGGWDLFDGPDVYIVIRQGATVLYTSNFFEDASPGFTITPNIIILDVSQVTVEAWDYDDGLAPDYLGGINTIIYRAGLGFPELIPIDCDGCNTSFSANLLYIW